MAPVLLSRYDLILFAHSPKSHTGYHSGLDPVLGVFTGVLAYYLYENNPRTAPPPDQKLESLVRWKMAKRQAEQQRSAAEADRKEA